MALRSPGGLCSVCAHPQLADIERELTALPVVGSERAIAGRFKIARSSLQRHRSNHMARAIEAAVRATGEQLAERGATTLEQVEQLTARALELLEVAEGDRDEKGRLRKLPGVTADGALALAADVAAATKALREVRGCLTLLAQLLGLLQSTTTVNVLVDARGKDRPEWARARKVIFDALRPWPAAAEAVAEALAADAATVVSQEGIAA